MKVYLEKAFNTFKENRQLYLQVSLGLAILLAASGFIGAITKTSIIFLFLLLPLIVSVFAIAMRTALGKECKNKDLYFGYHHFGMSLFLTTKMLIKPVLMGFLFYFLISLAGYGVMFGVLKGQGDPIFGIIASGNATEATNALMDLMTTNSGFLIVTYISLGIGFIVCYNLFLKRSLATLICFETTFTMDSAKKMSMNLTAKQNKFILFNNLFLGLYIILIVVAEMLQMIFFTNDTLFYLLYFLDLLLVFILMSPLLYINALFITHYYIDNHRDHVIQLFKDYLNVSMRTNQDKFVDSEVNIKNQEDEYKKLFEDQNKVNKDNDNEKK